MQDLWANFAGEAIPTEAASRGGGSRQRRLTEQAVLTALRAWLLQDYMLPYGTSLGATRIFKRCYWIDGLGNARATSQTAIALPQDEVDAPVRRGKQKMPTQASALPPALQSVATIARQLARLERPIALRGFALDERRGKRKATRPARNGTEASAALDLPGEGGLLAGTWTELAPALLAALEQSAAVFLLNPLKDGLFRYTDLAPLYQRMAPTELFLWLSHKQIETRLLPGLRTAEGAAALTNLLRGDRWKSLLVKADGEENPERATSALIDLCAQSMRPHFLAVQRLPFPMRMGPAVVEAAPYTLLFATRRQDSLYSLNDAVCQRARQLLAESHQGVLNEEWFASQRAEQDAALREALTRELLALGRAHRARRWPDLRQQLVLSHFGQHTLHDYDQIITSLLARGEVRCEWRKRTQDENETPVPGNDDLLLW
jgi:hypothetical protein